MRHEYAGFFIIALLSVVVGPLAVLSYNNLSRADNAEIKPAPVAAREIKLVDSLQISGGEVITLSVPAGSGFDTLCVLYRGASATITCLAEY